MAKQKSAIPTIISIRQLSKESNVPYPKIYHANVGTYNSLTDNERTQLFNVLQSRFEEVSSWLGFTTDGRRIKKI
jgi:hypothetical protein